MNGFFLFDKMIVRLKIWKGLPLSSKAVYPVILTHANESGIAYPSEVTIGNLCGRSPKTVGGGIRGLSHAPRLQITRVSLGSGRSKLRFQIESPPRQRGRTFPFDRDLIRSGAWARLKASAQALYPVLRTFARFDASLDLLDNDGEYGDIGNAYRNRTGEHVLEEVGRFSEYAGISRRSFPSALGSLISTGLVRQSAESSYLIVNISWEKTSENPDPDGKKWSPECAKTTEEEFL